MEIYFVYLTTNTITGKQYVGSHVTTKIDDGYLGSGRPYLSNAIKKYGRENFERIILKKCDTLIEARLLEEPFISKYNTLAPNGYNLSPTGGTGPFGGRHSEESKKKISESLKGKFKGRVFTEEWKEKLRNAKKDFVPWNVGKSPYEWTEEMRKVASETRTGKNNNMYGKKVYDVWIDKYGEEKARELLKKYKKKMSESLIGKSHNLKTVTCPHCGKEGKGPNMTRYHFDKCKIKR
jgi:group I intron endonuclease